MAATLAVIDFHDSEAWYHARMAVCAILELTVSLSRRREYKRLAKKIERLSIAVLDCIAKGYDGSGDTGFLTRATETIDLLETELKRIHRKRALPTEDASMLRKSLEAVKASIRNIDF